MMMIQRGAWVSSGTVALESSRRSFSLFGLLPTAKHAGPREQVAPPPPLPDAQYLKLRPHCVLEYVELKPNTPELKPALTVVLLHGAPGSYQDFRHIAPMLQEQGVRVLGINLPGSGGSEVAPKHYWDHISALSVAELTLEAVHKLCSTDERVFFIGHSFGGHCAINMAALKVQQEAGGSSFPLKGLVLLAPAGCRPHRVLRPKQNKVVIELLRSSNALVASIMPWLIKVLYTRFLRFSDQAPASHYVAGVVRAGTTDFHRVSDHVHIIARKQIPTFIAWSQNDEYMEHEIPVELARKCYAGGPRIAFTGGGHNIQKTRAPYLASAITKWMHSIVETQHSPPNNVHEDDAQTLL